MLGWPGAPGAPACPLPRSHLGSGSLLLLLLLVGNLPQGVSKLSLHPVCAPEAHAAGTEVLKLLPASPGGWEALSVALPGARARGELGTVICFHQMSSHTRHEGADPRSALQSAAVQMNPSPDS